MERLALFAVVYLIGACAPGAGSDAGPDAGLVKEPLFPPDVATSYSEVRSCRTSIDHDLRFIRVFADALAHGPYGAHDAPFPLGATLVKVEYEDDACTQLVEYTAMRKLEAGADPAALDWHWQRVSRDRLVTEDGAVQRCYTCHRSCTAPNGYDATCTEP